MLLKYFKVDKHVKEDKSLGNGDTILPSSTEQIFDTNHTIPHELILNDDIKPVVGTIMDKGTAMRDIFEKFSADEKARVGKCTTEY